MDTSSHSALWLCLLVIFCGFLAVDIEFVQQGFYTTINTAFDFDQAWFVDVIARTPSDWQYREVTGSSPAVLVKHPLMYSYLVFTLPLTYLGISADVAAVLVSLGFCMASIWLLFNVAIFVLDSPISAMFVALLYALSATFVAIATTIDSYTLVVFWMALAIFIYQQENDNNITYAIGIKALCYVMLVGTTSYFLLFVILLELAHLARAYAQQNTLEQLRYWSRLLLYTCVLFLVIFGLIYWPVLGELISDPIGVVKRAFWAVARPGEKQGALQVAQTLLLYSLYAPAGTLLTLENGQVMLDLRAANYTLFDGLVLAILVVLLGLGLRHVKQSSLLLVCCIWLLFTVVFHLFYQDRGSLFLYSPHLILCLFVILMYGLQSIPTLPRNALLVSLLLVFAFNSFSLYQEIRDVAHSHFLTGSYDGAPQGGIVNVDK